MRKCPECGFENRDRNKFCTHCGYVLEVSEEYAPQPKLEPIKANQISTTKSKTSGQEISAIIVIVLLFIGIAAYFLGEYIQSLL